MDVGAGLYMYDVVVEKLAFAISSPDELLYACHPCTFINKRNDHTCLYSPAAERHRTCRYSFSVPLRVEG